MNPQTTEAIDQLKELPMSYDEWWIRAHWRKRLERVIVAKSEARGIHAAVRNVKLLWCLRLSHIRHYAILLTALALYALYSSY